MDPRQAQIRERAGLEESKLNEDFIDFLRKYGFLILLVGALAAGLTSGFRWYREYTVRRVTTAFADFEAARAGGDGSPDALTSVAASHEGVRAVSLLARLEAADAYLRAVRRGVKPGSTVSPEGEVASTEDLMTDADRAAYLSLAREGYERVIKDSAKDSTRAILRYGALFGLAAVAECERNFDKAKSVYEQIIEQTSGTAFAAQGTVARVRLERLGELKDAPALLPRAELPDLAPVAQFDALPPGFEAMPPGFTPPGIDVQPAGITPPAGGGDGDPE
jgi:hypothetical protein